MKLGFVYAGQGSQVVGMGQALYQEYPTAKAVFDSVSLDFDVKKLCFEGPLEMLSQTQYTAAMYGCGGHCHYGSAQGAGDYPGLCGWP